MTFKTWAPLFHFTTTSTTHTEKLSLTLLHHQYHSHRETVPHITSPWPENTKNFHVYPRNKVPFCASTTWHKEKRPSGWRATQRPTSRQSPTPVHQAAFQFVQLLRQPNPKSPNQNPPTYRHVHHEKEVGQRSRSMTSCMCVQRMDNPRFPCKERSVV